MSRLFSSDDSDDSAEATCPSLPASDTSRLPFALAVIGMGAAEVAATAEVAVTAEDFASTGSDTDALPRRIENSGRNDMR